MFQHQYGVFELDEMMSRFGDINLLRFLTEIIFDALLAYVDRCWKYVDISLLIVYLLFFRVTSFSTFQSLQNIHARIEWDAALLRMLWPMRVGVKTADVL